MCNVRQNNTFSVLGNSYNGVAFAKQDEFAQQTSKNV